MNDFLSWQMVVRMGPTMGGYAVRVNPYLVEVVEIQCRFPRSKKKRIRKKWAQQRRNWRHVERPSNTIYLTGNTLHMHPAMWKRLKEATCDSIMNPVAMVDPPLTLDTHVTFVNFTFTYENASLAEFSRALRKARYHGRNLRATWNE